MKVQLVRPTSKAPTLGSLGACGYDCYVDIPMIETMYPNEKRKIPLGFKMEVPSGYVALLMPRSGTGSKGMHLANVTGVIDCDYRGELVANLHNTSDEVVKISPGERFVQMLIVAVSTELVEVVESLSDTERGANGFGSTGIG